MCAHILYKKVLLLLFIVQYKNVSATIKELYSDSKANLSYYTKQWNFDEMPHCFHFIIHCLLCQSRDATFSCQRVVQSICRHCIQVMPIFNYIVIKHFIRFGKYKFIQQFIIQIQVHSNSAFHQVIKILVHGNLPFHRSMQI